MKKIFLLACHANDLEIEVSGGLLIAPDINAGKVANTDLITIKS